jgi:hypothetical protein
MQSLQFRDPARLLELKQRYTDNPPCTGCVHWSRLWGVVICLKHEGRVGRQVSLCGDFERKEERKK